MNLTHQIDTGCIDEDIGFDHEEADYVPVGEFESDTEWFSMTFSYEVYPGFVPVGIFAFCGGAFFPTGRPPDFN